jgi:hypothetical protein
MFAVNIQFYQKSGYLIAPNLLAMDEIATLRAEAAYIFKGGRGQVEGLLNRDLTNQTQRY